MNGNSPLLTIAIPTLNRSAFLELNLRRLREELLAVPAGLVEVIVSDNHSTDGTQAVVERAIKSGLPIRYIRNPQDIGSDANIANCFNEARGHYVQIMGDDDLYTDGTLVTVLEQIGRKEYGVVCIRPYGYENDYVLEHPGGHGEAKEYGNVGEFLAAIGPYITFISACIVNRRIQAEIDARQYCGSNLVQVNLVVRALVLAPLNLYMTDYILAAKRNNSGGYDFSEVFVERLGHILDGFRTLGLKQESIDLFETRMLIWYHPYYLWRQRLARAGDLNVSYRRFNTRFGQRWLFKLWVAPIILLPRPLALIWGAIATTIGRLLNGDLRRGVRFAWVRTLRALGMHQSP